MSTTVDLGKITASVTVGTTTTGAAGTNASVTNVGTTQDAVLNFTIPRGAQGVQGPQGIQGNTGPAGPTGPQGPMGDVAVITPEQQAAFTMYSVPGQNTNGPMTQKAVTDNLVAGSISYDNSQSGLAAEDVQGALDELTDMSIAEETIDISSYIKDDLFIGGNGKWSSSANWSGYFVPVAPNKKYKVTAIDGVVSFAFMTSKGGTAGETVTTYATGYSSPVRLESSSSRIADSPSDAEYLWLSNKREGVSIQSSLQEVAFADDAIKSIEEDLEQNDTLIDMSYVYSSKGYKNYVHLEDLDYDKLRIKVEATTAVVPSSDKTLLEIGTTGKNYYNNYGRTWHDVDITIDFTGHSVLNISGNMSSGTNLKVTVIGYKYSDLSVLGTLEEIPVSIPNSPSAFVASNGKWIGNNSDYKGVFVSVEPNTVYRIKADNTANCLFAVLTTNTYTHGKYISTYADKENIRQLQAGAELIFVTPSDAAYINIPIISGGNNVSNKLYKRGKGIDNSDYIKSGNNKGIAYGDIIVAAYNAPANVKQIADFVCDGVNDEVELQKAIDLCSRCYTGSKILLSKGCFIIDSFPLTEGGNNEGNKIALKIPNTSNMTMVIEGDTLPYSADMNDLTRYTVNSEGTTIIVSDTCYEALDNNTHYRIIGSDYIDRIAGNSTIDFRAKNLHINIPWNQKKIIGIDCRSFNRVKIEDVFVRSVMNGYNGWEYSYGGSNLYPDIPVEGSIGIRMMGGSNAGMVNDFINVLCLGFYEGFSVGSEEVVMNHCTSYWCVYPYTFGNYSWKGGFCQPILMLNCAQYKCTNLPLFVDNGFYHANNTHSTGNQEVVMISYHGEHILTGADAPGGVIGEAAKETTNKMFRGYIDYGIRTTNTGDNKYQSNPEFLFWQHGYGEGFITRNNAHLPAYTTSDRNTKIKGNYLEKVFDVSLGKEVMCIDTENQTWVDANGNVV